VAAVLVWRWACSVSAAGRALRTQGAWVCLDLLDFRTKRLKVFGSGIAAQRCLDLGGACFQAFAGIFEVCRCCDDWTLLDGLNGLGQAHRLRFETLQAGIKQRLVGLVVHGLVAQGSENAEADQPEPH